MVHNSGEASTFTAGCGRKARRRRFHWRRIILLCLLITVLLMALGTWLVTDYSPRPTEMELVGSSSEMGNEHGRRVAWRLGWIVDLYLHKVVCGGDAQTISDRRRLAEELTTHWDRAYQDELTAMATASGNRHDDLAFGNLFLDIGNARAGCRSLVVEQSGGLLHAHSLDWNTLGGMAKWSTAIFRRTPDDGRFRTVSVGFPGLVGAIDIINEHGLALSFNQLGFGHGAVSEPVFLSMRRIAEHCATFEEAREEIVGLPPGMPFILTVSSAATGKASVFERQGMIVAERPLANGWVAAANQAQARRPGASLLDRILQENKPTSVEEVQTFLRHDDVLAANNLYSVIFDFRANRFFLASGQVPAAPGPYREYPLFR